MRAAAHGDDLQRLVAAVQRNCDIADARHGADMTLCIYLLQMREFFRWERGLPLAAPLPRDEIGAWIAERESRWDALEASDYAALPLPAADGEGGGVAAVDPFDADAVNARLLPAGLLYGAGVVGGGRPVFFLGELHARASRDGIEILSAGRELARGLLAPPAALAGEGRGPILLRREAVARWAWDKREAHALHPRAEGALQALVEAYGLDRDFDAALPRWMDDLSELLVLHELGEHLVGRRLGPDWAAMRAALPGRRAELHVRALRDLLADLGVTLPTLIDRGAAATLHAWFASLDGVRLLFCPALPQAYARWRQGRDATPLRQAVDTALAHLNALAEEALALYREAPSESAAAIETLLASPRAVWRG